MTLAEFKAKIDSICNDETKGLEVLVQVYGEFETVDGVEIFKPYESSPQPAVIILEDY